MSSKDPLPAKNAEGQIEKDDSSLDDRTDPPVSVQIDGGTQAWLAVFGSWLLFFNSWWVDSVRHALAPLPDGVR